MATTLVALPPAAAAVEGAVGIRGVRWVLLARLAVAVGILAYLLISDAGWGQTWSSRAVYVLITGVLALNVVYLALLKRVQASIKAGWVSWSMAFIASGRLRVMITTLSFCS